VLAQINDPENSAIIARTNRQLFTFQRVCTMRGIKYQILGKRDFWEQNEVKKLLALAKDAKADLPAAKVLSDLIMQHRFMEIYRHSGNPLESNPVDNLNDIVKMAAKKGTISQFLEYIRKRTHRRKSNKGVTLSTAHQAKGKEWKNVFVVGVEQGRLPHTEGDLSEEERIFFVACSRAALFLHISFSGSPSMFLNDFRDEIKNYSREEV
jgi:DNA helicase-2/ATP-dependent DNA helicase PcrA